jgi:hypothetical protein
MEDKKFIQQLLSQNAAAFVDFVAQQPEAKFLETPNGKWSVGQNLEHLIKSLAPVNQALLLPGFILRLLFGKPNRTPRSYSELVDRYKQKLAAGGRATGRFVPATIAWPEKEKKIVAFKNETETMIRRLNSWHEDQLDQYLLPHPLLGKLTLREMLFFSGYHIEHHLKLMQLRETND